MRRTVWQFPLRIADRQGITGPAGARPLTVQMQNGVPCLWMLVDENAITQPYVVMVADTGHFREDLDQGVYAGTFQIYDGALVFHVFVEMAS